MEFIVMLRFFLLFPFTIVISRTITNTSSASLFSVSYIMSSQLDSNSSCYAFVCPLSIPINVPFRTLSFPVFTSLYRAYCLSPLHSLPPLPPPINLSENRRQIYWWHFCFLVPLINSCTLSITVTLYSCFAYLNFCVFFFSFPFFFDLFSVCYWDFPHLLLPLSSSVYFYHCLFLYFARFLFSVDRYPYVVSLLISCFSFSCLIFFICLSILLCLLYLFLFFFFHLINHSILFHLFRFSRSFPYLSLSFLHFQLFRLLFFSFNCLRVSLSLSLLISSLSLISSLPPLVSTHYCNPQLSVI